MPYIGSDMNLRWSYDLHNQNKIHWDQRNYNKLLLRYVKYRNVNQKAYSIFQRFNWLVFCFMVILILKSNAWKSRLSSKFFLFFHLAPIYLFFVISSWGIWLIHSNVDISHAFNHNQSRWSTWTLVCRSSLGLTKHWHVADVFMSVILPHHHGMMAVFAICLKLTLSLYFIGRIHMSVGLCLGLLSYLVCIIIRKPRSPHVLQPPDDQYAQYSPVS